MLSVSNDVEIVSELPSLQFTVIQKFNYSGNPPVNVRREYNVSKEYTSKDQGF